MYVLDWELLKNREQHNETLFFRACLWPFLNSLNYKTRLFAAVNFCLWRFTFLLYSGLQFMSRFLTVFRVEGPQKIPFKNMNRKFFLVDEFYSKLLIKKVDRSKNTRFLFCEIFIKSKGLSKKFHFIMLFPNLSLTKPS